MAYGAHEVARRAGPETLACALHADIAASFPDAFRHTLRLAGAVAARDDVIVTIGCQPVRTDPAFGHVVPAAPLSVDHPVSQGGPAFAARFDEKPPVEEANDLMARGAVWYSGVCVWRARTMLEALRRLTPEVAPALDQRAALDRLVPIRRDQALRQQPLRDPRILEVLSMLI